MPVYEFICYHCGNKEEVYSFVFSGGDKRVCPKCGEMADRDWSSVGAPEMFIPYDTPSFGDPKTGKPYHVATKKQEKELEQKTGTRRID